MQHVLAQMKERNKGFQAYWERRGRVPFLALEKSRKKKIFLSSCFLITLPTGHTIFSPEKVAVFLGRWSSKLLNNEDSFGLMGFCVEPHVISMARLSLMGLSSPMMSGD